MYYKRIVIVPYKLGSASAKALQQELKQQVPVPVLLVSKFSKTYQPRYTDYVINWGCSGDWDWINLTSKRGNGICVNKLNFFQHMKAFNTVNPNCFVNVPEWTTDPKIVSEWIDTEQAIVVARKTLVGHSGEGIVLMGGEHTKVITDAPLYVKYKKKRHEYRVHFLRESQTTCVVVDVTQKKKRKGAEFLDTKIRNHKNGWVYAREAITEPKDLRQQALAAAFASDLDFGAVDLIWNELEDKCYVLEINTAPGLVGTTLHNYVNAFVKDMSK